MKLLGLTTAFVLFRTLLTFGQPKTVSKLDLEISSRDSYAAGRPILVTLTLTNRTDSTQKIEFTETHKYHKTLPFPTCISASIKDDKGENRCRYSSQYFLWSTLFTKEDLQYVDIKPGDQLSRDLKVNEVVAGCDCLQENGLKLGTYYVSLYVHGRQTNELEIEVK